MLLLHAAKPILTRLIIRSIVQPSEEVVLKILTVCTGNVCRSPLAHYILNARFHGLPVGVSSAGTRAREGMPITDEAVLMASRHGAGPSAAMHRAHLLRMSDLDDVDVVLTMARDHRREVVELHPALTRKTFTIREMDRLMDGLSDADLMNAASTAALRDDPRSRLVPVLALIQSQRATSAFLGHSEEDDVEDPYGRAMDAYERSTAQITRALPSIERLVRVATS